MNFEDYQNTMPYPDRPSKPEAPRNTGIGCNVVQPTSQQFRDYADALDKYANDMEAFRVAQAAYNTEAGRLEEQFRKDALEDVGLTGHPKADKAYAFAWEHGHSSGLGEVYQWLDDIADLLKD